MVIALQYSVVIWLGWGVVRLVLAHHFSTASLASLDNSGPMFNSGPDCREAQEWDRIHGTHSIYMPMPTERGEKTTHWLTFSGQSQLDIPNPWPL